MATLYRKYRSLRFDDVIGQEPIVTTLTNQIKLNRINHAYLFTGSRGVGKTTCARIFARAVNCEHPQNGSPCGECAACKALAADNVDIIEMDAASNNGVDDARDIREKVKYLPVSCRYKVYIIDEVHMLTGGAFNALLKTIEEPPEHVIFILATTEPQKLPQTILSRCIRFDFKLIKTDILAAHIARVYDAEGIKYTKEAAEEIARLGDGSVRDALSVADMLASAADVITPEVVLALTGAGESAEVARLFDFTCARDLAGMLNAVDGFAKSGKSMAAVAGQLTDYARNVLVVKSVGREKAVGGGLVNTDRASAEHLAASAEKFSMQCIAGVLENLAATESGLRYSVNPRVYLETALVKLICGEKSRDDLIKRITALENNSVASTEQKKNKVENTSGVPKQGQSVKSAAATDEPETEFAERAVGVVYDEPEPPPEYGDGFSSSDFGGTGGGYAVSSRRNDSAPSGASKAQTSARKQSDVPNSVQTKAETALRNRDAAASAAHAAGVNSADEGEFMHKSAVKLEGLELFGKIVSYLRKKNTPAAARARELLSRGVAVKERDDAMAFVAPDDCYLSVTDPAVIAEYNAALESAGVKKRARAEQTKEDILAEDVIRAKELFGKDGVRVG